MRLLVIAFGLVVLAGAALVLLVSGGVIDRVAVWQWTRGGSSHWAHIARADLTVSLTPPGGFLAWGRFELTGIENESIWFLLNDDLRLTSARWGERELRVGHGAGLPGRYHSEGRVVHVTLPELPADGRALLDLVWSGAAEHGRDGSDWRGILLVDEGEARMCEQTVFVPQVPLSTQGPAVATAPFTLTVEAPGAWELVSSAPSSAATKTLPDGRRLWSFASATPARPALLAGAWLRREVTHGGSLLTCLVRSEHEELAQELLDAAIETVDALTAAYGPVQGGSLGIVEQNCRPSSSYNWATDGLIVIDRNALGSSIPQRTMAHEVAHLWWGGAVAFDGPGERFLTEGGAEAAGWRALSARSRHAEVSSALSGARRDLDRMLNGRLSLALAEVGFGSRKYTDLAYRKGALVHRWVAGMLGAEGLAALASELLQLGAEGPVSLAQWRAAVARAGDGLGVPWLDHGGDLSLSLHDVALSPDGRSVSGRIEAELLGDDDGMSPRVRAVVALRGRGFQRRVQVEVDGSTTFEIDLTDQLGALLQSVQLDPDDLMPVRVIGGEQVLDGAALTHAEPAQDAAGVPMGLTQIGVTFDRPLEPVELQRWLAQRPSPPDGLRIPKLVALAFEGEGRSLRFTFRPLSPGERWWLPLRGALRDEWGGPPLAEALRFETAPSSDEQPPRIVSVSPPSGSLVSPDMTELVITWSEPMRAATGFKKSDCADLASDGFELPEMDFGRWDDSATVLTIPCDGLAPHTAYGLPVGRAYRDLSGNAARREDVTFTTSGG